ncbi:cytochrome c oxidase subunit 7A1, mitochondrial-like [Hermetia illucens]|uniref:cytochrome c oxidase subunit 7A1, mitochondrial-like n=1 Tax=Hermetia illucens TaxID=343691 RepID=UPI0018CC3BCA|nr:cytochrome c oxidase subunit 7A1, mitochondrial-like [Hermetia illucens]
MALPESLEKNMQKFQAKNDLPVFLKGGPFDRALFGTTMVLCGIGLVSIVHMIYTMGFKKKNA